MKKILLIPLFILLLVSLVSAAVVETIQFKDTNGNALTDVDYVIYTCSDASCSNVKVPAFTSGKNTGNSNNYGSLSDGEIVYPTSLETQYGYALYFYKEGYLPMEYFSDYHGNGYVDSEIVFQKKALCSAPINHIEVLNDVRPNIPLVIDVSASLDADTYSAFSSASNTPSYVPQGYENYYSAETKVTLNIYKSGKSIKPVYTETKTINLFMDSSQPIQFTWTPTIQDDYVASITTEEIDNQCSSSKPQTATASFLVHEDVPQNACYTILNRPGTSNPIDAEVGEKITITGDKSSYYIDNYQNIDPVDSEVTITITNSAGAQFFKQTSSSFSFEWVPSESGYYTIKVEGIATDSKCTGLTNYPSQVLTIPLIVYPKTTPAENILDLKFIPNQIVDEGSELTLFVTPSYYNGNQKIQYSADNLPAGATFEPVYSEGVLNYPNALLGYRFTWAPDYETVSHQTSFIDTAKKFITQFFTNGKECRDDGKCDFRITFEASAGNLNDQQEVTISVRDVNRWPHVVKQLGPYIVTEGDLVKVVPTSSFTDLDFDSLAYTYTAPLNQNGEWQTKVGDVGEYISKITASDGKATANQDILIVVRAAHIENQAPVFESIPDQSIYVGEELTFTIEANDQDNDALTYSAVDLPSGSYLMNQKFSWTPAQAGNYEAKFKVEDTKGAYDELTVKIEVKEKTTENHAPVFKPVSDKLVYVNELLTFTVEATDQDNDVLTYSLPIKLTGSTFNPETREFSWIPAKEGNYHAWFVVVDEHGAKNNLDVKITVKSKEQPPVITLKLSEIPSQEIKLGQSIAPIHITAEYDGESELVYSVENQPEGSVFENKTFSWTPKEKGTYNIIFKVTDGALTDTAIAVIIVTEEPTGVRRATKHDIGVQKVLINNLEKISAGEYFPVTVFAQNFAGLKEKNVRVIVSLPELNQVQYSNSFELKPKQTMVETFMFKLPVNTDKKEYVAVVTVSNDRDKDTKYASIRVE